jgi:general secretion pathway protein G
MMKINKKINPITGFTLIEMLLILVIVSVMLYMGASYMQQKIRAERIDRIVAQMQQIVGAGMAYYVDKNDWPGTPNMWTSTSVLQNGGYLPPGTIRNPWGYDYVIGVNSSRQFLTVLTLVAPGLLGRTTSKIIASKLPNTKVCAAYSTESGNCITACGNSGDCYLAVVIPFPGQNLNNATGANYVGIMHSGACVKAPTCPNSSMEPIIMVTPSSVIGVADQPGGGSNCTATNLAGCTINSYPITGYMGYATALTAPLNQNGIPAPTACGATSGTQLCEADPTVAPVKYVAGYLGDRYWRVCIGVDTSNGRVYPTNNPWGQLMGTVLVFTRCAPLTENAKNSGFNVYQ